MSKKFAQMKTRAEEIVAKEKALEQAKKENDKHIDEVLKHASRTRAEFVEKLYTFFDIEPETTERKNKEGEVIRDGNGDPVTVKTDRTEAVRIQKLDEALARALDGRQRTENEQREVEPHAAAVTTSPSFQQTSQPHHDVGARST